MSSNLRIEKSSGTPEQDFKSAFDTKSEQTRGFVWEDEMPDGDFNYSIDIYVICEDGSLIPWTCYEFSIRHPGYETVKAACFDWVRVNRR